MRSHSQFNRRQHGACTELRRLQFGCDSAEIGWASQGAAGMSSHESSHTLSRPPSPPRVLCLALLASTSPSPDRVTADRVVAWVWEVALDGVQSVYLCCTACGQHRFGPSQIKRQCSLQSSRWKVPKAFSPPPPFPRASLRCVI